MKVNRLTCSVSFARDHRMSKKKGKILVMNVDVTCRAFVITTDQNTLRDIKFKLEIIYWSMTMAKISSTFFLWLKEMKLKC